MTSDEFLGFVADIEVNRFDAQPLHFMINGTRHDIPRGQFEALVEPLHKAITVLQMQRCALTAECLCYEERSTLRVKKAGGVKLIKFHIGDPTTSPPGDRNAIPAGPIRVGCITIGFARAASRQHHSAGFDGLNRGAVIVQQIGTANPAARFHDINQTAISQKLNVFRFHNS